MPGEWQSAGVPLVPLRNALYPGQVRRTFPLRALFNQSGSPVGWLPQARSGSSVSWLAATQFHMVHMACGLVLGIIALIHSPTLAAWFPIMLFGALGLTLFDQIPT